MTSPDELRTKLEIGLASLIEDREQIDADIASVRKALGALDGKPTPAQFARASHNSSPKAMKKLAAEKPSAVEVIPAGELTRLVSNYREGVSAPTLAMEANADLAQVNTLLRELESVGKVHRTGERRGMRWHAIIDEDRVVARAAEHESQSKRTRARKN
jgi:hypothetical protein